MWTRSTQNQSIECSPLLSSVTVKRDTAVVWKSRKGWITCSNVSAASSSNRFQLKPIEHTVMAWFWRLAQTLSFSAWLINACRWHRINIGVKLRSRVVSDSGDGSGLDTVWRQSNSVKHISIGFQGFWVFMSATYITCTLWTARISSVTRLSWSIDISYVHL